MVENPRFAEALPKGEPSTDVFDARNERQRQVLDILERGVASILDSDGFGSYLRMLSRFHDYSANNTLLIMMQNPDATKVNSYDRWKQLGRQVQKGEKGIKIYFPMFAMREDPDTKEPVRVLSGFGIGNVFDVSQTDGEPLPEPPAIATGDTSDVRAADLNRRLSRWGIEQGLKMESKEIHGHARGYYSPREGRIVVRRDIDIDPDTGEVTLADPLSLLKTKTLVHELGHYVGEHRGDIEKEDAETVAESAAFVVMNSAGLDTSGYSFGYVAAWAKDKRILQRNLTNIQKVSHVLIEAARGVGDPFAEFDLPSEVSSTR